jgi:hypothetical protein
MAYSTWDAWQFLLGEWVGENNGAPGQGSGSFVFSFDLGQNILVRRNITRFPDSKDRPVFTHEDLTIHYQEPDGMHAIYFDNEGHTIHYAVEFSADKNSLILTSPAIPNAPRFRFTYIKQSNDSMLTRFEIIQPGQPDSFKVYLEGPVKKKGDVIFAVGH